MWKDPIVEEVRKVRKQLEKEYGSTMDSIFKRICEQQKQNKARLAKLSPKARILRKAA
jgi:hypothetical protein